jgi:hypothetical protein
MAMINSSFEWKGTVVGPRGNCGKRFLLSKPLWESAVCADFRQRRQFPQAFRFLLEKTSFR